VIVGNPPYVFLRNNNMKEEEKNYYKETYLLYQLKPRTDIYFFERSYKLLKTE
jgi:methylase of polypeptide subunit release factors